MSAKYLWGYKIEDIFNADETGLFFCSLPNRSMVTKGDTCKGGKIAKKRITVLLCCSAMGEKLKPMVIGHSLKPRCFKGYKAASLPVTYAARWQVTCSISGWIPLTTGWGPRTAIYCCCWTTAQLSLILRCPMWNLYSCHHKRPLTYSLVTQGLSKLWRLAKSVSVLDAILWLKLAWNALQTSTIIKCGIKDKDSSVFASTELTPGASCKL